MGEMGGEEGGVKVEVGAGVGADPGRLSEVAGEAIPMPQIVHLRLR